MIIFVENAFALVILELDGDLRKRAKFFFVYDRLRSLGATHLLPQSRVKFVSARAIRGWKAALGLFQFPILQPDPLGFAYKVNRRKLLISDGLLTEMLIEKRFVHPRAFYSVRAITGTPVQTLSTSLIIGSNWLEHGSMSRQQYISHLSFLSENYPQALYVRHPREITEIPEGVFGAGRTLKLDLPIDLHCLNEGVPKHIIGVCSTSMLALPILAFGRVDVDLIVLDENHLDGPRGSTVQRIEINGHLPETIRVEDMQRYLMTRLKGIAKTVKMIQQPQTLASDR